MKKHILSICVLLLCLIFGNSAVAQDLKWLPGQPISGQNLNLIYNPKGGDLEFSDQVRAEVALYRNFNWTTVDLPLEHVGNVWTANYNIPQHVVFLAVKFYQGTLQKLEALDNNRGAAYYSAVSPDGNKLAPGAYLAEALLTTPMTNMAFVKDFARPVKNPIRIDSLLSKEIKIKGSSIDDYLTDYLNLKRQSLSGEAFDSFAHEVLKKRVEAKQPSERLLVIAQRYYGFNLKDSANAARVEDIVKKRFPNSPTARLFAYQRLGREREPAGYQAAAEQFLIDFPFEQWLAHPDNQSYIYYNMFLGLARTYFEGKQYDQFLSLYDKIDFKTANEIYRGNITKGEMLGQMDRKTLFDLSAKVIPYLLARRSDGSYKHDFDDAARAQQNADDQMDDRIFTHISLGYSIRNYSDALSHYQYRSPKGQYGNAALNAMRMNMFKQTNGTASVAPLLEASVKANAVTPEMFQELKKIYMQEHRGNDTGYEEYLAGLTPNDKKAELRNHVFANMVNYPLPPFSLESAEGAFVSSSDWKDKIVVIDFWATWCRPCIEAFPGMQLLIDKYAKDKKVAVYMIGTMQSGDYKAKSVNYVKSQGYRFNLLHDAVGEDGNQSQVFRSLVPLFKSSGIPRKIIVKDGVVRYSSEGYSGSPSQLSDELSLAIETLRNEK